MIITALVLATCAAGALILGLVAAVAAENAGPSETMRALAVL
ncbi:MAG TPA: hypothetical protein VF641_01800 [Methylobacterium sp.]|jgi:hypothetical protein